MLFNSLDFAWFLPLVFALYWLLDRWALRVQNILILSASYVFYGWWDWRFLSLIAFSTLVDYSVGLGMQRAQPRSHQKILLWISILVNIGLLGFFKYYNFFVDNFVEAFTLFGGSMESSTLNIVLPVGISFYTFQTLSYTIDVYRGHLKPTKSLLEFASYVSFFPQLVAGPIERATNLLPQFQVKRKFEYAKAVDGMRQILWGFFKKVVIADNCGEFANLIFNNSDQYSGWALFFGAVFFAFQIYGDFSGYSDIAIGTARLFGFNLMQNFAFPYFSRDIAEFWRRWHISLSTWFRDYIYIPLGGSKGGKWTAIRNIFIIFLVSGFWHGANWTFIIWGGVNAIYFLPLFLVGKNRRNIGIVAEHSILPNIRELGGMVITFGLTVIAWVFFRATDLDHAWTYLHDMLLAMPYPHDLATGYYVLINNVSPYILTLLLIFILIEWWGRKGHFALEKICLSWQPMVRRAFYLALALIIFFFGHQKAEFIYFQF